MPPTPSHQRILLANRYSILEEIQSGGMTTVYKSRDIHTDELVAVKHFNRDRHLPEIQWEAYEREVEALKNIDNPNIVKLIDTGEQPENKPYIVLELMKHDLLTERANKGSAFEGWDSFAEIVILPILNALSYTHSVGIAHRDIKPANILISNEGVVKIADFGISKLKRWLMPRVTLNNFMSPPFSPPESDTGDFTYCRDVYSVGALCIWALSDAHISDHSELEQALAAFDGPEEVAAVIAQAIARDPAKRFSSAAIFASELVSVQSRRRQTWLVTDRKRCSISYTTKAIELAQDELQSLKENDVRKLIADDINSDSTVQRFVEHPGAMHEKVIPGHYYVHGSILKYHIAKSNRDANSFAIISVKNPEPHILQQIRSISCPSPLRFEFHSVTGIIPIATATALLESAISSFEDQLDEENRRTRDIELFDSWIRILDAKLQYERERSLPIEFTSCKVDGNLLTLSTASELSSVELGESRVIQVDNRRIRGEVWQVQTGSIVLNCNSIIPSEVPLRGIAKLDIYAAQIAVERQKAAIDLIRSKTTVTSKLRDLILHPGSIECPIALNSLSPSVMSMLDDNKQMAVKAALGAGHVFVVQGPPGTGKTEFISGMIIEYYSREPHGRVLLTSQTHIAIDNALERLGMHLHDKRILRVARTGSNRVSEGAEQFLIANQMKEWRKQVHSKAREGLIKWAERYGIDAHDMIAGSLTRQIAEVRKRLSNTKNKISNEEMKIEQLNKSKKATDNPASLEADLAQSELLLDDLREQSDSDKKTQASLEEELTRYGIDAKQLTGLSVDEQTEWAEVLVGGTSTQKLSERLVRLQGEWLDRFGASDDFMPALIESSSVVASTCVGLASLEALENVDFDLCIIDEASKATAMECCVPMVRAKKWVLVGDSKQLAPFKEEILAQPELRERFSITSSEAEESLFERFTRLLPKQNIIMLTRQYRMVEPIGRLISECFYDGALVSERKVIDPAVCKDLKFAVNWLSTSMLSTRFEQAAGTSCVNSEEASRICDELLKLDRTIASSSSKQARSVLILSAYGAQVNHLERRIRNTNHKLKALNVECCTVDRVQGRQADIVLFSVTRSNQLNRVGFLRVLERINVALSRARDLLVIVGDHEFVQRAPGAEPLQRVLSHIQKTPGECVLRNF